MFDGLNRSYNQCLIVCTHQNGTSRVCGPYCFTINIALLPIISATMSPNCVRWAAVDDKVDVVAVFAAYENDDLIYPLVNVYKKLWKDPPFLMGKSTINVYSLHSYGKIHHFIAG